MKIKVEIKSVYNSYKNPLKAIAVVIIEDCFIIKSIRVVEGFNGLFINMPSKKNAYGEFVEQCHPITRECKAQIDNAVITAYKEFIMGF